MINCRKPRPLENVMDLDHLVRLMRRLALEAGDRIMAVYGVPLGLLCAGPLIARYQYPLTATLYCIVGLACTGIALAVWHRYLWRRHF